MVLNSKSDSSDFGVFLFHFDTSRVTSKLRYYPKEYVQQFMAEAMSFVLRNAPDEQLKRGIDVIDCFLSCQYIFPLFCLVLYIFYQFH